jgi:hypothetical protein
VSGPRGSSKEDIDGGNRVAALHSQTLTRIRTSGRIVLTLASQLLVTGQLHVILSLTDPEFEPATFHLSTQRANHYAIQALKKWRKSH